MLFNNTPATQDRLISLLHGSGFDGHWKWLKGIKDGVFGPGEVWTIDYHHMDDNNGYYDGWTRVNVQFGLPAETFNVVKVTFTTDSTTRRKYLWDSYIEDTIYECINGKPVNVASSSSSSR
jgi:hypothetical protein